MISATTQKLILIVLTIVMYSIIYIIYKPDIIHKIKGQIEDNTFNEEEQSRAINPSHNIPTVQTEIKVDQQNVIAVEPERITKAVQPPSTLKPKPPIVYLSLKPMHCVAHGMRQQCVGPFQKNLIGVNQCQKPLCACYPNEMVLIPPEPISDPNFPPVAELLPIELATLYDEEFTNILDTASATKSTMALVNMKSPYNVGDTITVKITLIDGFGKPRLKGGDDVRIWMKSLTGTHKASGNVRDLNNGTYIASLKALWVGDATVHAALPFTREVISTMLKWRRQYQTLFYYFGVFSKGELSEHVICSPYPTILGYKSICNLTANNYDYPWFCGRPLNPLLTCTDFEYSNDFDYTQIPVTPAQFITFDRTNTKTLLKSQLNVNIVQGKASQQQQINCNKLKPGDTWDTTMPSGYFSQDEWKSLKCVNPLREVSIIQCLKNTTLILYGDSTTRQWYSMLVNITLCVQKTGEWTKPKWYEYSVCENKILNFTLVWAPHVSPFPYNQMKSTGKLSIKSVVASLNELPNNGKIIIVLHYYCHFVRQHYTLFKNHIRSLKTAMKNAMTRNKDLQIAIKAPHVFYDTMCPSHLNDFQGRLFIDILQSELKEFKDSVWYLNLWDMNTAVENGPIHPKNEVVWEYLRLLFGFTCK